MQVTLLQHFCERIEALTGDATKSGFSENKNDKLGIAVSGGPDSMALLSMAHAAWPGRVQAASVDHKLRADSADETAMVARYCDANGIPHRILEPAVPIKGNIQSSARAARYALLNAWANRENCRWIATAHHADDQLETLLMRLARGSGLDGMSGIRARTGHLVRPLLDMRKEDLYGWCAENNVPFVIDPSNANRDYDRVRMRETLASLDMLDARLASRSAAALADASAALDWVAVREASMHVRTENGTVILTETKYPHDLKRRLVLGCLHRIDPDIAPRGSALTHLIGALEKREKAMIGDIICQGGQNWTFAAAPLRGER